MTNEFIRAKSEIYIKNALFMALKEVQVGIDINMPFERLRVRCVQAQAYFRNKSMEKLLLLRINVWKILKLCGYWSWIQLLQKSYWISRLGAFDRNGKSFGP